MKKLEQVVWDTENHNTVFAYNFNFSTEQRFVDRPVEDFKPVKPTLLPNYNE